MDGQIPIFEIVEHFGQRKFTDARKIAEGGCASVYKVVELTESGREVAIKVIECKHDALFNGPLSWLKLFRDELIIWKGFSTSQHVLRMDSVIQEKTLTPVGDETYFLGFVMEYSEIGDLGKNLVKKELYGARKKELFAFMGKIALGIKEGHDKDIAHGDIKPKNILLFRKDRVVVPKVMDFGMGISASADVAKYGGTPEYLAPERFGVGREFLRPNTPSEAKISDIYSLGVLFYEIICEERPHQAELNLTDDERWIRYKALHKNEPVDFEKIRNLGYGDLADLIKSMMAKQPEERAKIRDVTRKLEGIYQDSITLQGREEDCPIATRTYAWNPAVHRILGCRLYYYLIRGRTPNGDPVWFKNYLAEQDIRFLSFYRILGGYDYILRLWAKPTYSDRIDAVVELFKKQQGTDSLKFSVNYPEPHFSVKELKLPDEDALIDAISQCANPKDKSKECDALLEHGLIGGKLMDYDINSTHFFLAISVGGTVNDAMLKMYAGEMKRHLETESAAMNVNFYRGSGNFQLLADFRLLKFQDFRPLYEVFLRTCEVIRMPDSQINAQTYIELDTGGVPSSDDGSIIGDLLSRMD